MSRGFAFRSARLSLAVFAVAPCCLRSATASAADSSVASAPSNDQGPPEPYYVEPPSPPESGDSRNVSPAPAPALDASVDEPTMNENSRPVARVHMAFGTQWFWATNKAMAGLTLRTCQGLWWGDIEASLIFDTGGRSGGAPPAQHDGAFLGAQLGGYFMLE